MKTQRAFSSHFDGKTAYTVFSLYLLFGPAIIHNVAYTPQVENPEQPSKYAGYNTVEKLDLDWFGNWTIIRRGREEEVLKCSDSIFYELSVNQHVGH